MARGDRAISVPVAKMIMGVLYNERTVWEQAAAKLVGEYGPLDEAELVFPFDSSEYYRDEMGPGLVRHFLSFRDPVPQEELAGIKIWTNDLEVNLAGGDKAAVRRRVNLDPGLLTLSNLVLATTKGYAHRIYIKEGIYAEVTLICRGGSFHPLEWTYPDYRREDTLRFFNRVREGWRLYRRDK